MWTSTFDSFSIVEDYFGFTVSLFWMLDFKESFILLASATFNLAVYIYGLGCLHRLKHWVGFFFFLNYLPRQCPAFISSHGYVGNKVGSQVWFWGGQVPPKQTQKHFGKGCCSVMYRLWLFYHLWAPLTLQCLKYHRALAITLQCFYIFTLRTRFVLYW